MSTNAQEDTARLSRRVQAIQESLTLSLTEKLARLKAQGVEVLSFGAGEPDFDTPEPIKAAAREALAKGQTKYTPSSGILPLREAIARKTREDLGVEYSKNDVLVSAGAKQSLFNLFQALLDEGDEAVFAAPYWVSYPEMVKTAGAKPVAVEARAEDGLKLRPEALEAAITPRTRVFVHCSPSNPTGVVYTRAEQEALASVLRRHDVITVSDEVYDKLVYGVEHVSLASLPGMRERTVVVNSCSKTYAMTGWRLGWAAGPSDVIAACAKVQSQSTSNPNSIAQHAALAALTGDQSTVEVMRREYEKRRDVIVERLRAIPGVTCVRPMGAFYAFPDVSALYGRRHKGRAITDSASLAEALLESQRISVVPGDGFGAPAHVRLSYATSMENIVEGIARFARFVSELE